MAVLSVQSPGRAAVSTTAARREKAWERGAFPQRRNLHQQARRPDLSSVRVKQCTQNGLVTRELQPHILLNITSFRVKSWRIMIFKAAKTSTSVFLKLWSADHKWSSRCVLVVLQKR
jgi:hypothetical protein